MSVAWVSLALWLATISGCGGLVAGYRLGKRDRS